MCKIINILVISLVGLVGVSVGQILQTGQCNEDIQLQTNFDFESFQGIWYENALADHPLGGDCSTINFTSVNNVVNVNHKTVRANFFQEYNGTATVVTGTAKLTLNMSSISSSPIDFWIMLTDYSNFALAYRCENVGNTQRQIFVWQLGRNTTYPSQMIEALMNNTMINVLGINSNYLRDTNHGEEACYVLPTIQAGQPVILPGQCNTNISAIPNFNAGRFLGVWHQVYGYHSESSLGSCNRAQYSSQDGVVVDVINSEIIDQTLFTIEGNATVASTDNSGRLRVILEVAPNVFAESELVVLGSDYDNWAISYSCTNIGNNQRRVFSWIVSRTRELSTTAQTQVNSVVNSFLDLNFAYYEATNQSNAACFYIPEPNNEPVVFGGQCDLNVPVQQNFLAANYLGLWHQIEGYPAPFQNGTCVNALYTLGQVAVEVLNTQVINETLDTINGFAYTLGSEGKLIVSFPVAGTNLTTVTDYWIIATDYTSFSLVYSCRNINDYQQQITVWKLSRTKSLTAAANTTINNALTTQPFFNQSFFETTDQSREGCFYYPEPVPGQQVVFPGQCADDNIPVVQNLNLTLFAGQWYETEAYPKDPQPGQCIDHQFTVTGNTGFNLISNNVDDQILGTSNSQLVFLDGTNARFNLTTFIDGGGSVSFPYYIVDTDYNNYALAYSCVDINDDFKGIFSWKLSRTRQLSTAASASINATIENIVTISNEYFEPIQQSDNACFYFPDLAPGELVVLPGQCDNDTVIPVVNNFNATAYLGRWRMIQSYPSANQVGDCNQATYSLGNDSIIVYNNEVQNQTLREINGVATLVGNGTIGKLIVTLPSTLQPFELWILDTDYDNYALVYGCQNINNQQRQVFSWKMSRTTNLTEASVTAINQVISNVLVLNERYYYTVNQTDAACFYYPDLIPGSTTIFRGQCNESIPVVTNFNAVAYMGLWHDVQRYPAPFQNGTCGNAFYTLLAGPVVDVLNTQVLNETLDTIVGSAVLDLANELDTSAKLLVTFPVGGFNLTTPYWVLATDYTSYALVYSCSNINNETRSVTSWKLSRTKSLSTAANNAISAVTSTIDVLDDRYYLTQDQSPEGCFFFPEPQPGVPVVFPGDCDANLTVVQNFNLTAFEGLWHEIEAYPKVDQPGQCISHEFTPNTTNALNFRSLNVFEESLGISTGSLRFTSTDNSARLELSFISNGTNITIPYWIIDTDYENYALAYSCVNQEGIDFRGVWSWKLSRTKSLSQSSIQAINNATGNITVLNDIYYEPISQSDESCFFYPDLAPGELVVFPGQCDPNITVVQNFNASRYLGRWNLIESYPSNFQQGTCNDATYSAGFNGTITVFNTQVIDQELATITGSAVSVDNSGKLLVTFPSSSTPSELWILDTDYDSYALVYSCENINTEQRRVHSWKLSRNNSLTQAAVNAINQTISGINVLDDRYYYNINRTAAGCFYFPEPNGNSVIFRGQCNESIEVVTNFNAVGYMGLWHDIQRYPAPFQNGTCGNAFYTLLDGPVVDVLNTQVFNQTLDTIRGSAVLDLADALDTSAKLLVTFPVGGFNLTTPYWVLSTDYTSYALVYSCSNINTESMSVSSWKLSRSKSLTPAANNAMNAVVNTITVLDDRYYETQNQSPEGCFFFPEPQPGVPVVFPGDCDANLTVVQNFNLTAFQGLWHEIEAYPKIDQPGQCISHEFSPSNSPNILNFQSLNVLEESLGVTNGILRFTSTDNSARLELSFVSNGTTITIPYWIVDTDYENYALAYSCVNQQNVDYRGVWSWKLSRTKSMSLNSTAAIDSAISDIDVLDNIYYEPISQSDESCFYYPVLGPNEPVTFPGQCDTSIPAVPNFNASRYLGTWRLIESYYTDNQQGTCNEATYSAGANGTVTVFNTHVVNEELRSITGSAVVAAADGSGKLEVTFPNSDTPSELWILATDYDSYSLAYSCENISSNRRRVFSWKLSRTNSLSQAAVNAINATISTINVLDQQYYNAVNRSDAACFYFPVPDGSAVIFRGQCNETINTVPNFNASRYMGSWNYIESYPAPFVTGTCGSADYNLLSANVFTLETSQVVRQELLLQNGTAVRETSDTSAKYRVTFDVNGRNLTSDYWVLATDYDNYALVYSCQNLNEESRRVIGLKLSRSQNLTVASQAAITNAINQVQVLDQQYFEDVEQSEEACFFYPDNNGGDVILNGQCVPDAQVAAVTNFSSTAFGGIWHEVSRFPLDSQVGDCANKNISVGGLFVNITQTEVYSEFQTINEISGTLATDGRGVINIQSAGTPFNALFILDTDYSGYALIYGCRNVDNATKQIYSWKLSRSRDGLSEAAINHIDELVFNNTDLFKNYYSPTDQSNDACFHYPVFDELPGTIDLFGPCDQSIQGVPNFNVNAFLGRWMEVGRYPQPTQRGTCNRAYYTAGNDFDIRNVEVRNQTRAQITGFAVVASNDSSGVLNVTLTPGGQTLTSVLQVLATDYTSYALLYGCVDLENGRRISSWKLSRTPSLAPQVESIIDFVINQTQGLNQQYYQQTSQRDEDCFYVPTVDVNSAPLFRGQCNATVAGIANFNSERFAGWWHEIERYPVDNNRGECISSQYQGSGTSYQVIDTVVANGTAQIDTGTVQVSTNGRLTRTINGQVQDIWVLATDYDNYALLYSCEQVDDEYIRVWSAKHSKARQLTAAAQAALAPIIEANNLLYPQFYQQVNQSDEACFHYPAVTGQQVILPGQCDDNIPVVQNFNVGAYEGTWYQIERYPQIHENGTSTCIGARYTLDEASGVVTVLNWEVINGQLSTIVGNATIASSDGSAKLSVVLPVVGSPTGETVTTSLYVLTTNYNSYSLAYSCYNINNFQRSIGAWKLSRERTLSASDNQIITTHMASREELHQPYFIQVAHDANCEEPSSGTFLRSSIIVMVICALWQMLS